MGGHAQRREKLVSYLSSTKDSNFDTQMGLTDNHFHDYSLETGAYINQKTIRPEAGLLNLYVWVAPFGLMPNQMKTKEGYE